MGSYEHAKLQKTIMRGYFRSSGRKMMSLWDLEDTAASQRGGDVLKMLISRLLSHASRLRTMKMEFLLINMRVLLRIQRSWGHKRTSLRHQVTRTTKRQEVIVTQMMTIQDTILTIATGEPLFSVGRPMQSTVHSQS